MTPALLQFIALALAVGGSVTLVAVGVWLLDEMGF